MRMVIIDNASGFVWGIEHAESAVDACESMDRNVGEFGRDYEAVGSLASNESGYHVYRAPDGWNCDDGQDADVISEVNAMDKIAIIKVVDPNN